MSGFQKNTNWTTRNATGGCLGIDHAQLEVLMDIRRELQTLNRLLACPNFTEMPSTLQRIARGLDRRTAEGRQRKESA